mgnify:CR=1 FL=1
MSLVGSAGLSAYSTILDIVCSIEFGLFLRKVGSAISGGDLTVCASGPFFSSSFLSSSFFSSSFFFFSSSSFFFLSPFSNSMSMLVAVIPEASYTFFKASLEASVAFVAVLFAVSATLLISLDTSSDVEDIFAEASFKDDVRRLVSPPSYSDSSLTPVAVMAIKAVAV